MRREWRPTVLAGAGLVAACLGIAVGADQGVLALGLLLGVMAFWLSARWPVAAVTTMLAWLPLEIGLSGLVSLPSVVALVSDLVAMGVLVGISTRVVSDPTVARERAPHAIGWAVLSFIVVAIISLAWNRPGIVDAMYWLRGFLRFLPFALVASVPVWRDSLQRSASAVAVGVGLFEIALGLAQLLTGGAASAPFMPRAASIGGVTLERAGIGSLGGRIVVGTTGHYNIYGLLLVLLTGVYLAERERRRATAGKWAGGLLALAALASAMVVASESRQAVVCLVAVWVFYALMEMTRRGGATARVALALVAVVLGAAFSFESWLSLQPVARLAELGQAHFWEAGFAQNRGYVAGSVGGSVLRTSPLIGFGPGALSGVSSRSGLAYAASGLGLDPRYTLFVADVGWVNILAHVGLLGVLATLLVAAWLLSVSLSPRVGVYERVIAFTVTMVVVVGSVASTPLVYKPTGVWLYVMASLVIYGRESAERGPADLRTQSVRLADAARPTGRRGPG